MLMKTKVTAIVMVLISMGYSAFFIVKQDWVKWCIAACAVLVVSIIISTKTKNLQETYVRIEMISIAVHQALNKMAKAATDLGDIVDRLAIRHIDIARELKS